MKIRQEKIIVSENRSAGRAAQLKVDQKKITLSSSTTCSGFDLAELGSDALAYASSQYAGPGGEQAGASGEHFLLNG